MRHNSPCSKKTEIKRSTERSERTDAALTQVLGVHSCDLFPVVPMPTAASPGMFPYVLCFSFCLNVSIRVATDAIAYAF